MRKTLLASAAVFGMALATPALAQDTTAAPPAGTGQTMRPMHTQASNIEPSDTRNVIAPRLPEPNLPANASPADFLQKAQQDVQQHRGGAAEEALGHAETRLLTRSAAPSEAGTPNGSPAVQDIAQARHALAHDDWQGADQHIAAALQHAQMAESGNGMTTPPGQASAMPPMSGTSPAIGTGGGMTAGTHSVPMGGVMPPNGGVMAPNGGVMPPNPQ